MENNLDLDTRKEIVNNLVSDIQNNCLKTEFGKAVNAGLDFGLRAILPEEIGEKIINIKNNIYNFGFKEGLDKSVNETTILGKSSIGLINKNFENISQVESVIKNGGGMDKISDLLDKGIDNSQKINTIDENTTQKIKNEKNIILENIEQNLEKSLKNQKKNIEKFENYVSNWKDAFKNQNYNTMKREYNKMVKFKDKLMINESILNDFKMIENIQNLLKNNGNNFDLSEEEIELANKLVN